MSIVALLYRILEYTVVYRMSASKPIWILVAGSGSRELPAKIATTSRQLGRLLAESNFNLISGGWPGVDQEVSRSFALAVKENGHRLIDRFKQYLKAGTNPEFPSGRLITRETDNEAWDESIAAADAIVLIGGLGGTYQTGDDARRIGKPVLPLADTSDDEHSDARKFYFQMLNSWDATPISGITSDEFSALGDPAPDVTREAIALLQKLFGILSPGNSIAGTLGQVVNPVRHGSMTHVTAFISYSHDSDDHRARVLGLSERLRRDGVETILDQYVGSPPEGWPRWMLNGLDTATHVLCVCTKTYYRRFRGLEGPNKGKGVDWEGSLMTQALYDARSASNKFIAVLFDRAEEPFIPEPLRPRTHHLLTSEASYQALHDELFGHAAIVPSPIGNPIRRSRATVAPLDFPGNATPSGPRRASYTKPRRIKVDPDSLLYAAKHASDPIEAALLLQELPGGLANAVATATDIRAWLGGKTMPIAALDHPRKAHYTEFSQDGGRILTNCDDMCVRVWRTDGRSEPTVIRHNVNVNTCHLSPLARWVMTVAGGVLFVWDCLGAARLSLPLDASVEEAHGHGTIDHRVATVPVDVIHRSSTTKTIMSCDDRYLAVYNTRTITIISLISARTIGRFVCQGQIISLSFSPRGDRLVLLMRDSSGAMCVEVFGVDEGAVRPIYRTEAISHAIVNMNADTVAMQHNEAIIRLLDVDSLNEIHRYPVSETEVLTDLANGTRAVKVRRMLSDPGSFEETIYLPNGERTIRDTGSVIPPHHELGTFTIDGRFLIFGNHVRSFWTVRPTDGRTNTNEMVKKCLGLAKHHFSRDGATVAMYGEGVSLYSVPDMRLIVHVDARPGSRIAISVDNTLYATRNDDDRIDVWSIAGSKPLALMGDLEDQLKELRESMAGVLPIEARRRLLNEPPADAIRANRARTQAVRTGRAE